MKQCKVCSRTMPFTAHGNRKYCDSCAKDAVRGRNRQRQQDWRDADPLRKRQDKRDRIERKKRFIRERKDVPCGDCLGEFPHYVMHFHHLRDKKFELCGAGTRSFEAIEAEIAKCVVLCANCHAIRHNG